jgi:DNA mismatch repair protein MutL
VIKEAVSQACREIRGSVNIILPKEAPQRSVVEMHAPEGIQEEFFSGFKATKLQEQESAAIRSDNTYIFEDRYEEPRIIEDGTEQKHTSETACYRLIGSLGDTYVLVEQGGDLLIIDQHAAHERLLYEEFKSSAYAASQTLLEPCVITVSHEQKNLLEDNIEAFRSVGFDIELFGALEYKISSVPYIAAGAAASELVNDALSGILGGGDITLKREAIIRAACRSAVKAGDKLSEAELKSLTDSFLKSGVIPTCPHGRPVISVVTKKQLEKSFKRVI